MSCNQPWSHDIVRHRSFRAVQAVRGGPRLSWGHAKLPLTVLGCPRLSCGSHKSSRERMWKYGHIYTRFVPQLIPLYPLVIRKWKITIKTCNSCLQSAKKNGRKSNKKNSNYIFPSRQPKSCDICGKVSKISTLHQFQHHNNSNKHKWQVSRIYQEPTIFWQ